MTDIGDIGGGRQELEQEFEKSCRPVNTPRP